MTGRDCHAAAARRITRSRHLVIARKSRQFHARVDPELREHVAEMAVDRVRRDEETLGDLAICQPLGDEPGDRKLSRGQRGPTARLGLGGDEAAAAMSAFVFAWPAMPQPPSGDSVISTQVRSA